MLDCAIIGVGPAGLVVARDLRDRGLGVIVFETRDHMGGRIKNGVLADDQYVELGGQWIDTGCDAIFELIERYGLRTIGIPARGNLVVRAHGRLLEVPPMEDGEELAPFEVANLSQGLLRLRRLTHRLTGDPAWVAANGAWLRQDLRRWTCTGLRTSGTQARFGEVYEAAFGPTILQATSQEGLQQVNSGPGLETMTVNNGRLNQRRVDGGMAAPCDALAADLGDAVRLESVMTKVTHDGTVIVTLASGETTEARIVVSTLPPHLAVAPKYDPPLLQWRQDVAEKVMPGNAIRAYLVYEAPFWRGRGLLERPGSDEGAVRITFDAIPVDSTRGLLVGFLGGNEVGSPARCPLEARRRVFVGSAVHVFGVEASEPVEYLERDWSTKRYIRGRRGTHFAPGIWTSNGPVLTTPDGCLYWAGAEYLVKFSGYMESAVRSDEEVVATIVVALI